MTDQEFFQKCDNLEKRIKQLEAVVGKIEAESKPEFKRVEKGASYYTIQLDDNCRVVMRREEHWGVDNNCYNLPNYFHTKKRAQEVADKIKFLIKLERLHDIYCPDYKPDWNSTERKYLVYFDHSKRKYGWDTFSYSEYAGAIYFPTKEIAQKVCDVLNKERKEHDNS